MTNVDVGATTDRILDFRFQYPEFTRRSSRRNLRDCLDPLQQVEQMLLSSLWFHFFEDLEPDAHPNGYPMAVEESYRKAIAHLHDRLNVTRLSYQSPYEIIGYITLSSSSAIGVAAAFIHLRDRFWDSQLHKTIRQQQVTFFKEHQWEHVGSLLQPEEQAVEDHVLRAHTKAVETLKEGRSHPEVAEVVMRDEP